jgi:hypothetical protein
MAKEVGGKGRVTGKPVKAAKVPVPIEDPEMVHAADPEEDVTALAT